MAYANGTRQWHTDSVAQRTTTRLTEFSPERLNTPEDDRPATFEAHSQNAEARTREVGAGFELVRRAYVRCLRTNMNALYEHGSLADMVALCAAFEQWEKDPPASTPLTEQRAILIESLLKVLNIRPEKLPGHR